MHLDAVLNIQDWSDPCGRVHKHGIHRDALSSTRMHARCDFLMFEGPALQATEPQSERRGGLSFNCHTYFDSAQAQTLTSWIHTTHIEIRQ